MTDQTFELEILTPRESVFKGEVVSLVAPGVLGYLGVLPHHAPLMTTLAPGKVILRDSRGAASTFQSKAGGLLEVYKNKATLLAEEVTS